MSQTIPFSISSLRSHSIFIPPAESTSTAEGGWELVEAPESEGGLAGQRYSRLVMRDKDLIVAMGRDIRMTSLTGRDGWDVKNGLVGNYKTLKSPHLTFEINQIALNPTGRLLAVIGHHQLVVLVLPKTGFASSVNSNVTCRSFPVDEFQHSPSSTDAISKVLWHPWGEGGNSLWVLAANGKLFEYDILQPQDPVQTFNFLPELSAPSSSRFSAADPLSEIATSFAFSHGEHSFGPLMVYVLIANGDLYTMGPILPLHSDIPTQYLSSLKAYTDVQLSRLKRLTEGRDNRAGTAEHAAQIGRVGLQSQWVDSVIRQVNLTEENKWKQEEEEDINLATPSKHGIGLLNRSMRSRADSDISLRPQGGVKEVPEGMVRIHPPHLTQSGGPAPGVQRALLRQGPIVFSPAFVPSGDDVEEEEIASDIFVLDAVADEGEDSDVGPGAVVIAIAWSGGRVDLGVEVESPEPRWISSRDPSPSTPTIPIIESILLTDSSPTDTSYTTYMPAFTADPLHHDIFYIQHSSGIDSICVSPWISGIADSVNSGELPGSDVTRLAESPSRSRSSSKPIIGVVTFCNITLGYGLLALASSGQLATVEMDLRMTTSITPTSPPKESKPISTPTQSDTQSLLLNNKIDFDKLVLSVRQPLNTRSIVAKVPSAAKPLQTVDSTHLRAIGEVSLLVQKRLETLRAASATVEQRLDLQTKEYSRQLNTLRICQTSIESLKNGISTQRALGMMEKQRELEERLDKVLSGLSAEYRPGIGEVERKWFDELERLKSRVWGGGTVKKGRSLASRTQVLKEQLSVIKPLVESQRQAVGFSDIGGTVGEYGSKQLKPLEAALSARSNEIGRLMRKMENLSFKLETVSPGPDEDEAEP